MHNGYFRKLRHFIETQLAIINYKISLKQQHSYNKMNYIHKNSNASFISAFSATDTLESKKAKPIRTINVPRRLFLPPLQQNCLPCGRQ